MRTTVDLPGDAYELLEYYAASRDETMAALVPAARDGDASSVHRIVRNEPTGLLMTEGGPKRTSEELRQLWEGEYSSSFHQRSPTNVVSHNQGMERLETNNISATDLSDGREVQLSFVKGIVSVRRRHRLGFRELHNHPAEEISFAAPHTFDIDGAHYQVGSAGEASNFLMRAGASAGGQEAGSYVPHELSQPLTQDGERWQYAVVNTGAFNTSERLAAVLATSGRAGWELVTIFDKSSNWLAGMEKGFMLLRRRVPPGVKPESWAIQYRA